MSLEKAAFYVFKKCEVNNDVKRYVILMETKLGTFLQKRDPEGPKTLSVELN